MFVLRIPQHLMREDASPDEKTMFEYYKRCIKEIQEGTRSGMILPSDCDPDSRQYLFNLEWIIADTSKI